MLRPSITRLALILSLTCCVILSGCGGSSVTKSNYDKITNGMTQAQVEAILGKGQEQSAAVAMPGVAMSAKQEVWKDGDKSIMVVFTNGKVSGKTASNL